MSLIRLRRPSPAGKSQNRARAQGSAKPRKHRAPLRSARGSASMALRRAAPAGWRFLTTSGGRRPDTLIYPRAFTQNRGYHLRDRVPSLEEFKALFPNIVFTDNITKQKKLVKYVLVGLDRQQTNPAAIDYEQMTIEHVAPQSFIGQHGYDDALIGQMGNLILMSEELNGKLENKAFKDKKRILTESGYKLPTLIEQATAWTGKEIKQRTEAMAEEAYNTVWKP